ncbi:hypothetical protein GLOIN_2v1486714 [Rhizophagus clarus]|uniref:Uncharacterized protein n=1 Tax=Rhizophagus clarus TaxID=94130 RepID=A0A8H3L7S0_9GLOM|nr:hypothetical protein GLOIN_2v1486714 [Rhizophagus clarus]
MDIEISHSEANQSTINMMLITKESNDETSFQPVLSKSQKKKQRKKAKAEQETSKARKNSRPSLDPLAKQFIPPKSSDKPNTRKVVENEASTVITGYQPALNSQAFVHDIIFLQERKERERYQAAVLNPSESMTSATLIHKNNEAYLISHNINMFKEVKLPDGKRKIIGYLSNWDDLYRAKTRPGKKVTTGTNNILVHHSKGNASRQQYSSSTKPGKDSLKTETIANIDWYQLFIKWKQQASPLIELNNELQEIYSEDYQFSLRELEAWKTFLRTAGAHNITS